MYQCVMFRHTDVLVFIVFIAVPGGAALKVFLLRSDTRGSTDAIHELHHPGHEDTLLLPDLPTITQLRGSHCICCVFRMVRSVKFSQTCFKNIFWFCFFLDLDTQLGGLRTSNFIPLSLNYSMVPMESTHFAWKNLPYTSTFLHYVISAH